MKIINKGFIAKRQTGFTLIELLIVIAILGVLSAAVLLAINPKEKINQSKDTTKIATTTQLGRALSAHFIAKGAFPSLSTTWITTLQNSKEVLSIPSDVSNSTYSCTYNQNGYCYNFNASGAIIFLRLQAASNIAKCSGVSTTAWEVYSTANGKSGIVCQNTNPQPGTQTFY